ncbi:hypothetical protein J5U23_01574 [Saccharolobus shibatae B12]|uniref:Uncharacterized protein n=1 Tax=Saccharolobus shibatae (strain ATCC 51178 / DSM 5389 / JCM 8931 / NBRC 15437 / B12) TaxID=523848 RepID=A0A8F5BP01_SACSH|nr:ATP-binding protein [Saccharolobus shibatae]QXJ28705.1 hypothetical protein J5U23_01574 [Saccharolobus shibatae B12]
MIEEQNPWWISPELIRENEYYRKYQESKVKWDVTLPVSLEPYSLNFLFGPRQVGKTTGLILLIKRLLDKGYNPKSIFYFACDKLADYKELDEVLEEYDKIRKKEGIKSSVIILDEITFPKEWFRSIKYRIDVGKFSNDVLILSGSLSMKAKGEIETFPGRRGKGEVLVMFPLPFSEYVKLFGINLPTGDLKFILENYTKYIGYLPKLKEILEYYLVTGGFPNAVKDFLIKGKVSQSTEYDFISGIISDINKLRRSERFFKLTARAIIERTSSEYSFHTISKDYGVGTVKTAISYVNLMEKLYFMKVIETMDANTGLPIPRKQKKFYFIDPFIYHAFSNWTMTKPPDESKLIEAVIVSHLSRFYDINYVKSNEEVDVIVKVNGEYWGVEIKYGRVRERRKVLGKVKKFIYISKEELGDDVIPAPLFLAMLKIPIVVKNS